MFELPAHMKPLFPRENKYLHDRTKKLYVEVLELADMIHPITITRKEIPHFL